MFIRHATLLARMGFQVGRDCVILQWKLKFEKQMYKQMWSFYFFRVCVLFLLILSSGFHVTPVNLVFSLGPKSFSSC